VGDVHNLTFSTFGRQAFLGGKFGPSWFIDSLRNARNSAPFHLFAYVIMPEHVHIVLQPLPGAAMRRVLTLLKRPVTEQAVSWVRAYRPDFLQRMTDRQPGGQVTYRFWLRGGGYDRNLRSAKDVHEKIAYDHNNPVRRGLVSRAEDWPWSSAREWITREPGPVPIDWASVPEPGL
jgi:putative transposase